MLLYWIFTPPPNIEKRPFKCYVTLVSREFDPHPPPRNANNIESYTFITLFSEKADTPSPPKGPFKCYVTLFFSGNWTPTHPLVTLITLNITPS